MRENTCCTSGLPIPWNEPSEVFRLTDAGYLQVGAYFGEERVRAEPFEAVELELDLGGLWLSEPEKMPDP
jgi:hypothetical protein